MAGERLATVEHTARRVDEQLPLVKRRSVFCASECATIDEKQEQMLLYDQLRRIGADAAVSEDGHA
jgi:hypothetical protein